MSKEKTLHELAKEFPEKTYRELERYRDADRVEEAIGMGHNHPPKEKGICIIGEMRKDREGETEIDYHRYWKDMYEEEHKKTEELQLNLARTKKENNGLYNRIADSLEVNESHQKTNGKLRERLTELEEENKKMHVKLDEKIDSMRKSGM